MTPKVLIRRKTNQLTNQVICSRVSTILWLHHMDFDETLVEKVRWELHKDAVGCSEQILERAPYKTAAVWSLTSDLTNYMSKMNKTLWVLLKK